MKIQRHPGLLESLAASYALGTLRGPARRRFEAIAREQAPVRAAALIWQSRLSSINELQPDVAPSPAVWTRIANQMQAEHAQAAMLTARTDAAATKTFREGWGAWLRDLTVWRVASAAGATAAVTAITMSVNLRQELGSEIAKLQTQLQATPQIEYVAVLSDDNAAASVLVTFDRQTNKLTLQRVGNYLEAGDRSLQLWALPQNGGPKSLGVLTRDKLLRLPAGENDVREVPALAISLEPKGGVASETGPTGPVLFKGALIQKMI